MSGKTTSKFYLYFLVAKIINATFTYSAISIALLFPIFRFYIRDRLQVWGLKIVMISF